MQVAGVDEAGRGPWAGPIVSAACILPKHLYSIVKDSKVLSEKKRQMIYDILMKESIFGIGIATNDEIDTFGIVKAFELSIKQFIDNAFKPKLLLHACCAPCATSVIERLIDKFRLSVFFFNPNIQPKKEYELRLKEIRKLCEYHHLPLIVPSYNPHEWFKKIKRYKHYPEGSKRCTVCYAYRLYNTAIYAKKHNFDYFTTTLSVSPLKKYDKIKNIGKTLEALNVEFLDEDFKKKDGFKRSCELSKSFNFYRQNYCGCIYSYYESINRKLKKTAQCNID